MKRVRRPKGLMPTENILEYGPLPLPGGYQVHHRCRCTSTSTSTSAGTSTCTFTCKSTCTSTCTFTCIFFQRREKKPKMYAAYGGKRWVRELD